MLCEETRGEQCNFVEEPNTRIQTKRERTRSPSSFLHLQSSLLESSWEESSLQSSVLQLQEIHIEIVGLQETGEEEEE